MVSGSQPNVRTSSDSNSRSGAIVPHTPLSTRAGHQPLLSDDGHPVDSVSQLFSPDTGLYPFVAVSHYLYYNLQLI